MENLFSVVRDSCSRETWSEAVAISRGDNITTDKCEAEEIVLRVLCRRTGISRKVVLWPMDEDWKCECAEKEDPCRHVAAAVIALHAAEKGGLPPPRSKSVAGHVSYRFCAGAEGLRFERYLVDQNSEELLTVPLSSLASQRVAKGAVGISPTSLDMEVEVALGSTRRGVLSREALAKVLPLLARAPDIALDGRPVRIDPEPTGLQAVVYDDGPVVRIKGRRDPAITHTFQDTLALCGDTLRPLRRTMLDTNGWESLKRGLVFGRPQFGPLVAEFIPRLSRELLVINESKQLPLAASVALHVELVLATAGTALRVVPLIAYGDPAIAFLRQGHLEAEGNEVPIRDMAAEAALKDRLWQELALVPETAVLMARDEALAFIDRARRLGSSTRMSGDGLDAFRVHAPLKPLVTVNDDHLSVDFVVDETAFAANPLKRRTADTSVVLKAFLAGESLVPLLGGGFAPLPRDFLARFGARLLELMEVSDDQGRVARPSLLALAGLCDDMGLAMSQKAKALRQELTDFTGMATFAPPADLVATLRPYQESGSSWLCTLKKLGLGALLADDMGLGKTLQTLVAIDGGALVVAPTSVIFNWKNEIARFRPALQVNMYYGAQRQLDALAHVTLTTYALLRLDSEALSKVAWKMVVLDEGHNIKNPTSQVAQAAFGLPGEFKVVLTGTPVENSLDDLWSLFRFLNPGLLGSYAFFQDHYVKGVRMGREGALLHLRDRIKPFVLRRLKAEVAPELPIKTEVVRYAQLSPCEREIYGAIYAATRREIVEKLGAGARVLDVLEAILRLRQACCHSALLPGRGPEAQEGSSAKLDLMLQTVREAVDEGHKVLIFSQWTSFLDLIGEALLREAVAYERLDGASRDRQGVVCRFQAQDGAPVLIMSLKAGGVGLNLTAADHVIIMDPWWNPAVEDQAADRAHRIGQLRPVVVHRLVALDTIEEKILLLQEEKKKLAACITEGGDAALALTKEDLLLLFD